MRHTNIVHRFDYWFGAKQLILNARVCVCVFLSGNRVVFSVEVPPAVPPAVVVRHPLLGAVVAPANVEDIVAAT